MNLLLYLHYSKESRFPFPLDNRIDLGPEKGSEAPTGNTGKKWNGPGQLVICTPSDRSKVC